MKINFLLFGGSLATFTSGTKGAPSFALSECSNGRTCVRNIQDCDPSTDSDCALVAFNVVGDKLNVTLTHSSKDTYVAVGFAPGTSMAKADITYCQYRSSGVGIVSAYSSRNGRPDDLSLVGYTSIQTAENNDVYECHFQKDRMMEKSGQKYNMDTNDYHVLLAKGNMNGNSPSYHGYGNKNRMATSKISFKAPVTQAPTSSPMASSSTLAQGKDTPDPQNNDTPNEQTNDNSDYEVVSNNEMADHDDHSGHGHSHDVEPNDITGSNALQSVISSIFAIFLTL